MEGSNVDAVRAELVRERERTLKAWQEARTMNNAVAKAVAEANLLRHDREAGGEGTYR